MKYPEDFVNRIICGDCCIILKDVPSEVIDLTVTSPPYDSLRDYKGYDFDFEPIAKELFRITKQGGVVVWVVGDATINGSETGTSFWQALYFKNIGFNLHDTMIYEKSGFANPASNRYHQTFEYMFVFSKGPPKTFNPLMDRPNKWAGQKHCPNLHRQQDGGQERFSKGTVLAEYGKRFNVWKYNTGGGHMAADKIAHKHPAVFPEQLAIDHIKSWSNEGNLILDPMCGSGTTCFAAKQLGRNFIGIDISEEYCQLARKRLEK